MKRWHPPIPAGIATSAAIHNLQYKTAVLLLVYCYDSVRRDGRATINLKEAAAELQEPYGTVRRWWQELRNGPFFCEQIDRGKLGWDVKFADDWIDWHVLSNNFERSPMNVDDPSIDLSMTFERSPVNVDTSGNKVLIDSDLAKRERGAKSASPTPKKPKTEKAHDPTLDHLAVITYRATFKRTPNADQRQAIIMAVTDNDLWSEICALWKQNRWDYLKVENLINRYQKNGANRNGTTNGTIRSHSGADFERAQWRSDTDDKPV